MEVFYATIYRFILRILEDKIALFLYYLDISIDFFENVFIKLNNSSL